jgi:long-chain acyl-CoA synthetase
MSKLYSQILDIAAHCPTHEAIIEDDTRWTYQNFTAQIDQAAAGFKAMQVQAGERVGLMLYNQKEFLVCFFALRKIGAVVVPINLGMLRQDIAYVIQNSGIRHLVIADSLYSNLQHVPLSMIVVGDSVEHSARRYEDFLAAGQAHGPVETTSIAENNLAFLLYTSGTTGNPKGVMLSEKNILANIEGLEQLETFGMGDRFVLALPLFHSFGLIVSLISFTSGASLTLIPKFHPKNIVEATIREQATILPLVPTLYSVILDIIEKQGDIHLPHLRFCISGGASLPVQLLQRIKTVMKTTVLEGYGMTETSPVLTLNDPAKGSVPGSVGNPLPNVQVRIVGEDQTDCKTGEIGEIWVKGDNIMLGYYQLPEETQAVLDTAGWLRTGDLGHLDENGLLFISGGRKKDLIIKAGENISPVSIENVLYHHSAIREAAVIGVPDAKLGESIMACVSLQEGQAATAQEIIRFCREQLSPAYVPAQVEFFDELPKNPTGKIAKKLLRDLISQRIA